MLGKTLPIKVMSKNPTDGTVLETHLPGWMLWAVAIGTLIPTLFTCLGGLNTLISTAGDVSNIKTRQDKTDQKIEEMKTTFQSQQSKTNEVLAATSATLIDMKDDIKSIKVSVQKRN